MIKISLITPTRDRPEALRNLFESLVETTFNLKEVELLLAIDDDDEQTLELAIKLTEEYPVTTGIHTVKRSDHFSKDYYNYLSLRARGRWIMAINDDSLFVTKNWDKILDEAMSIKAEQVGDDIILGIIKDGQKKPGGNEGFMSCWVLSSQEYVTLMNGLLMEELYTWGGDYWIGRLFCKVQQGQRKLYIPSVLVDHISHHTKDMPQPPTFKHFQRIESEHPCLPEDLKIPEKTKKINEYIKKKKDIS